MVSSKECLTCPLNAGFESGQILCGRPSQRCRTAQAKLPEQETAAWSRMTHISKLAARGMLDLSLLVPDEYLHATLSLEGEAYGKSPQHNLRFKVGNMENKVLTCVVTRDSLNDSPDPEAYYDALLPGSEVQIHGGFERFSRSPRNGFHCGLSFDGELVVGRRIAYRTPDILAEEYCHTGSHLQELTLINPEQTLGVRLFNTNPDVYRPAPPPGSMIGVSAPWTPFEGLDGVSKSVRENRCLI